LTPLVRELWNVLLALLTKVIASVLPASRIARTMTAQLIYSRVEKNRG
jgi:ABC-type lipoprotein release transport system permease subunit